MIEVRRGTYMNESEGVANKQYDQTKNLISEIIEQVIFNL